MHAGQVGQHFNLHSNFELKQVALLSQRGRLLSTAMFCLQSPRLNNGPYRSTDQDHWAGGSHPPSSPRACQWCFRLP